MLNENNKKYICECSCGNPEHLLVFHYYIDEEFAEYDTLDVYFISRWYESFWNRCKIAFKYIFRKHEIMMSDAVCFNKTNIEQLENFIIEFKIRMGEE